MAGAGQAARPAAGHRATVPNYRWFNSAERTPIQTPGSLRSTARLIHMLIQNAGRGTKNQPMEAEVTERWKGGGISTRADKQSDKNFKLGTNRTGTRYIRE